jgi:hypothetical protein
METPESYESSQGIHKWRESDARTTKGEARYLGYWVDKMRRETEMSIA